jgi:DNA repair protein RecO (recombination protein O)
MLHKTRAIILHTLKYGESSIIAQTYNSEFGRHSFIFKGIRGKKSKIRPNLLQPLSVLNIEANIRKGRDLSFIKEASPFLMIHSIFYDVKKSAQALFMAEVLYHCLREEEANPALFEFLVNSIEYFDNLESGAADFHLLFLIRLTKHLGFYPRSKSRPEEKVFDLFDGVFRDNHPGHSGVIDAENSELINRILISNYEQLNKLGLNQKRRNELLDYILKFYSIHIEEVKKVKSHKVHREIF